MSTARVLVALGALLALLAGWAFIYANREAALYWYEPLSMPLPLGPGSSVQRTLTVHTAADYEVELAFARALPYEQLDALVNGKTSPLRVRWQLTRGSERVAGGEPGDRFGSSGGVDVSRILGRAPLEAGMPYELRLQVENAPSELAVCSPRVKLVRWFVPFKHHFVKAQMAAYGGILAVLLSLLALGGAVLAGRRGRDTSGASSGA